MQCSLSARVAFPRPCSIHASVTRTRAVLCHAGLRLVPCGDGSVAHINAVEELPEVSAIDLTEGLFEVGRVDPAEIVLGLPTVSGRHCLVSVEDGAVAVTDLGSTNGTKIDGEVLVPMKATKLAVGSQVVFGDPHLAAFVLTEVEDTDTPADA